MDIAIIILVIVITVLVVLQAMTITNLVGLAKRIGDLEEYISLQDEFEELEEKSKELKRDFDKMLRGIVKAGECDCGKCNPGAKRKGRDINEMFSEMFKNAEVKSCSLEELLSILKKEENEEKRKTSTEKKRKTSTEKKGETNDQDKHEDQGKA